MVAEPKVPVFFYGSYMSRSVLAEIEFVPEAMVAGRLHGYDITIAPLANLEPSDRGVVYGLIAEATHAELARLYGHAEQVLGGKYLPFPVLVELIDGTFRPALCYIAPELTSAEADPDYVARVLGPAREARFPDWYLERLESFR